MKVIIDHRMKLKTVFENLSRKYGDKFNVTKAMDSSNMVTMTVKDSYLSKLTSNSLKVEYKYYMLNFVVANGLHHSRWEKSVNPVPYRKTEAINKIIDSKIKTFEEDLKFKSGMAIFIKEELKDFNCTMKTATLFRSTKDRNQDIYIMATPKDYSKKHFVIANEQGSDQIMIANGANAWVGVFDKCEDSVPLASPTAFQDVSDTVKSMHIKFKLRKMVDNFTKKASLKQVEKFRDQFHKDFGHTYDPKIKKKS